MREVRRDHLLAVPYRVRVGVRVKKDKGDDVCDDGKVS
jgi:hypothetical protein